MPFEGGFFTILCGLLLAIAVFYIPDQHILIRIAVAALGVASGILAYFLIRRHVGR